MKLSAKERVTVLLALNTGRGVMESNRLAFLRAGMKSDALEIERMLIDLDSGHRKIAAEKPEHQARKS